MLASMCTQWAVLSWGGETQAIIYNPKTKKVISIDVLRRTRQSHSCLLPLHGIFFSARVWSTGCNHTGYTRRTLLYAG